MESALLVIAMVTLIYLIFTLIESILGYHQIKNLSHQTTLPTKQLPSVSIILSALNEEEHIADTIHSLMQLDYPSLEIIVINDRSTDHTPIILKHLAETYSQLKVIDIHHLPPNWLGKNHALYVGAQAACGEWLLFTDADVRMKKHTLSKALSYVLQEKLDHLTIHEHHLRKTFWLKIVLLGNYIAYSISVKPWRIRFVRSKKSLGHGAFNLVNHNVYDACLGHKSIAMSCIDDLKLGELIKTKGFKQNTIDGRDFIEREWYGSLRAMVNGLEKNSFAFFNYSLLTVICNFIFAGVIFIWPVFAVLFFKGPISCLNALNVLLMLALSTFVAHKFRLKKIYALLYPMAICIILYVVWNSTISTLRRKGVMWRGTFYPLDKLKEG